MGKDRVLVSLETCLMSGSMTVTLNRHEISSFLMEISYDTCGVTSWCTEKQMCCTASHLLREFVAPVLLDQQFDCGEMTTVRGKHEKCRAFITRTIRNAFVAMWYDVER